MKSHLMHLSDKEKAWLPWFGHTGKLALGWSCYLNRDTYADVERTFEGIANTRVKLLNTWVNNQWSQLEVLLERVADGFPEIELAMLQERLNIVVDVSEYFVIDTDGRVINSTYAERINQKDLSARAVKEGLKSHFLHGPYEDNNTLIIGPSSSKFHDGVTLMFYLPIKQDGVAVGAVCARIPNDVIGDLIQREAGHIYKESGDNYLFMVDAKFDASILSGTALSRSRFEDSTFSHGENLKSGVNTKWGAVKVENHTEFEIRFTDPATLALHPGVRETIKNGENLFVTYPGYSDYRHIPVIGKGVTFQLKGSPDTWGMMCEGDLEEVYRRRSINIKLMYSFLSTACFPFALFWLLHSYTALPTLFIDLFIILCFAAGGFLFYHFGSKKVGQQIRQMTNVIQTIAEGEGNLQQRLDENNFTNDETGDMGRWMNSFIDNLDNTIGQVISASSNVQHSNEFMIHTSDEAGQASRYLDSSVLSMLNAFQQQVSEIQQAFHIAEDLKQAMSDVAEESESKLETMKSSTQAIRDVVTTSAQSVKSLDQRTHEVATITSMITDITNQTNLLALNAAIEAARAGESGRGFSVVADEVRNLAAKTAHAAAEIQTMLEGIKSETHAAVVFMEQGTENVDKNLHINQQKGAAQSALYELVDKIVEAISQLNISNHNNSDTVHHMGEATEQMKESITAMKQRSARVGLSTLKLNSLVNQFTVSNKKALATQESKSK